MPQRFIYTAAVIILLAAVFFLWKKARVDSASDVATGVQENVSSYMYGVNDTLKSIRGASASGSGNKVLAEKNMVLEAENGVLKAENERLRGLAGLKASRDFRNSVICFAMVIGANDDGFIYYYTINRGSEDGVEEGDGVITGGGVAGRIIKVSRSTSMVQLLTDVKSSISIKIPRSKVIGILSGENYNSCIINFVPKEEDVKEGDLVVTSGLGRSFPEGIPVGIVTAANRRVDGLSMSIRVKPMVRIMSVGEVAVLRKK
ncbi:MAG: rod shape-determining protein MreC [Spirochaetia bacterium]|nr:rod shape-determining protein MreC [Spirochaetia bacterium]